MRIKTRTDLENHLATRSYIEGYTVSNADTQVLFALNGIPSRNTPHTFRWALHIIDLIGLENVTFLNNQDEITDDINIDTSESNRFILQQSLIPEYFIRGARGPNCEVFPKPAIWTAPQNDVSARIQTSVQYQYKRIKPLRVLDVTTNVEKLSQWLETFYSDSDYPLDIADNSDLSQMTSKPISEIARLDAISFANYSSAPNEKRVIKYFSQNCDKINIDGIFRKQCDGPCYIFFTRRIVEDAFQTKQL
jgi:hypothetical protein